MAISYATYVDNKSYNADYERPATLSLVGDVKGMNILDAGCAAGWYSKTFLDMGAKSIVGLDFSPKMIDWANIRLKNMEKSKYKFYCHDLNKPLDYLETNSFDKIVSSLTLHYLSDWTNALNEFNRLLKQGGELIISTHHPFMEYLVFEKEDYFEKKLIHDTWNMNGEEVEVEFYSRPLHEIIGAITKGGFYIETILEPMPTEKFKEKNKGAYEKLTKRPQFLFIKAVKR